MKKQILNTEPRRLKVNVPTVRVEEWVGGWIMVFIYPDEQVICVLFVPQMQVEPDHVVCVRLILRQPSLAWLTFSLEDIRIFPLTEPVSFFCLCFCFMVVCMQKTCSEVQESKVTLITKSMREERDNNELNEV